MPYQATSKGRYSLLVFDDEGKERNDDPNGIEGLFSKTIVNEIASGGYTDVFILSHGWMGDVGAAKAQYSRWIEAMETLEADREALAATRPGFKEYRIGVHWPSLPWGDEGLGSNPSAFGLADDIIEAYVERLGDRPGLRENLQIVFDAAAAQPDAIVLPEDAKRAYLNINGLLSELGTGGEGASPDADRENFDPAETFNQAKGLLPPSFSGSALDWILAPLRQLSFWKMKQRALTVGSAGMNKMLRSLQLEVRDRGVRFHLMGHSFGCIVVSSMLTGHDEAEQAKPVASLALVQGALSLWSYCGDIPVKRGTSGYFLRCLTKHLVDGPIITTRSKHDTALGIYYPLAAGVARQIDFAAPDLPKYGAVGSFGAQGLGDEAVDLPMKKATEQYPFAGKPRTFNIEASEFIIGGQGASGAHSEINGSEVAHAIWQAAMPKPHWGSPMSNTPVTHADIELIANGIDADTGCPLPAISREAVIAAAERNLVDNIDQAKKKAPPLTSMPGVLPKAVVGDFDPDDLSSVGWGIVFPADKDITAIRLALAPLIDRRKYEAGDRFFIFDGSLGVQQGETAAAWLSRQGRGPSLEAVDPDNMVPFYLLIVATPAEVSMEFQYLLDMFWAVGRIHFEGVEEYARYAKSVASSEAGKSSATQTAAIFATEHPFDAATALFTRDVAKPFAFGTEDKPNLVSNLKFQVDPILGKDATKDAFAELLRGNRPRGTPSVLLSGTHGMAFSQTDVRLADTNGALICQDWQGYGQISHDHWFSAADVPADAQLGGMIYVLFACYGGGWSEFDTFRDNPDGTARKIAPGPGLAKLPLSLLSHPNGGALAVLAHIDRAWSYSFRTAANNPQNAGLRDVLRRLLKGQRVGLATDQFNLRWAATAVQLSDALRDPTATTLRTAEVARLWVQRDDARNYVVLGDPAVRVKLPDITA